MEHNLAKYLSKHPECEIFCGQDAKSAPSRATAHASQSSVAPRPASAPFQKRVTLWHKVQKRKVVGNAAPLERNVQAYLEKHPEYEIYDPNGELSARDVRRSVEKVLNAIVTSVANENRPPPTSAESRAVRKIKKAELALRKRQEQAAARAKKAQAKRQQQLKKLQEKKNMQMKSAKQFQIKKQQQPKQRRNQMSGGKRPMIGAVDRVAKRLAREVASSRCGITANFSLLLNVAAWESSGLAVQEKSHGLLDLLVEATNKQSCVGKGCAGMPTAIASTSTPESPPISPMMEPAVKESGPMAQLFLEAPSSIRAASSHRLAPWR